MRGAEAERQSVRISCIVRAKKGDRNKCKKITRGRKLAGSSAVLGWLRCESSDFICANLFSRRVFAELATFDLPCRITHTAYIPALLSLSPLPTPSSLSLSLSCPFPFRFSPVSLQASRRFSGYLVRAAFH